MSPHSLCNERHRGKVRNAKYLDEVQILPDHRPFSGFSIVGNKVRARSYFVHRERAGTLFPSMAQRLTKVKVKYMEKSPETSFAHCPCSDETADWSFDIASST